MLGTLQSGREVLSTSSTTTICDRTMFRATLLKNILSIVAGNSFRDTAYITSLKELRYNNSMTGFFRKLRKDLFGGKRIYVECVADGTRFYAPVDMDNVPDRGPAIREALKHLKETGLKSKLRIVEEL